VKTDSSNTLQPWQFFVLAALGCATAVTFVVRSQGVTAVILMTVIMGAASLVGLAVLRSLRPLLAPEEDERPAVVGQRVRAGLEQEKALVLRTIKELEFDRAMGKLSDEDFHEMGGRLRGRAARLIRQLDAGVNYRAQIEADLAKRLGTDSLGRGTAAEKANAEPEGTCARCSTVNDPDARFCKGCGEKLS